MSFSFNSFAAGACFIGMFTALEDDRGWSAFVLLLLTIVNLLCCYIPDYET
jgi:hypothetical protein